VLGGLLTGCLALPFATPPLSVSGTVGGAFGQVVPPGSEVQADSPQPVILTRVGLRPLGMIPDFETRRFGFVAGYEAELFPRELLYPDYTRHGGFLSVTHYPWISEPSPGGWFTRIAINAGGDVLVIEGDPDEVGGGMTFSADLELITYGRGGFAGFQGGRGIAGGAFGEGGIGLQAAAGVRGIGNARYWIATAGVSFRLPATGGILLVPIWDLIPDKD